MADKGAPKKNEKEKLYKQERTVLNQYWTHQLEAMVKIKGTDKSKFIREAIIEKLKSED
jgi:hypothetical protein